MVIKLTVTDTLICYEFTPACRQAGEVFLIKRYLLKVTCLPTRQVSVCDGVEYPQDAVHKNENFYPQDPLDKNHLNLVPVNLS